MPKYIVAVDVIDVHLVPVLAPTAEAEAERIITADRTTWFDHTEPMVVGDALTEAEQESISRTGTSGLPSPLSASQPKAAPTAKFKAPRTDHHEDGTECSPAHKHSSSGKPLTEGCPGRAYSTAACTCGWRTRSTTKGYVDESRKRHLTTEHS
ncbi:hypothetical protein ACFY2K_10780 [Kitasatospora sp. NPDC001309]|uniref:hypothetical protein n=1 Tax=Kitasatospora sp. NPDC001309 TaxID=3364013 RepID=UPI0036981787